MSIPMRRMKKMFPNSVRLFCRNKQGINITIAETVAVSLLIAIPLHSCLVLCCVIPCCMMTVIVGVNVMRAIESK